MEFRFKNLLAAVAVALVSLVSCTEKPEDPGKDEPTPVEPGISNVINSYEDKHVSSYGATVSIKFDVTAAWEASVECIPEKDAVGKEWAKVNANTSSGEAKKAATVRITINENETSDERTVVLYVTMEGAEPVKVATLKQAASGSTVDAAMNETLNTFMHDILKKDYLFADAYNATKVDLTIPYTDFLNTHLNGPLGDANIEDGGYYKAVQNNPGERYIYSSLVEIQPVTKAAQVGGLGFGPLISSSLPGRPSEMSLSPSYVRRGSPAENIGLRRGDMIYEVNGTRLTTSNYRNYMSRLYNNPQGAYTFSFLRFEPNGEGGYDMNAYTTEAAHAGAHLFDPILHASILTDHENDAVKIGYLVFETFDLNSQEFLEETIAQFVAEGITDMILDLRFNYGGAVAQSRWLSGCIAGAANYDKTFCKVIFNDGRTEDWTFGNGYTPDTDNLGKPNDLGLKRLFVIGSYNTASASELLINSLKGIDFPVKLIGSSTEGKNVGMNVTQTEYKGRHFQFQPVTFYVRNAKDFGDYADGFMPDEYVNNDNSSMEDDADNVFPYSFSDWGNMDFNIALQWAYCDITGKPRWDEWTENQRTSTKSSSSVIPVPVDFQPMAVPLERAGNLIYRN